MLREPLWSVSVSRRGKNRSAHPINKLLRLWKRIVRGWIAIRLLRWKGMYGSSQPCAESAYSLEANWHLSTSTENEIYPKKASEMSYSIARSLSLNSPQKCGGSSFTKRKSQRRPRGKIDRPFEKNVSAPVFLVNMIEKNPRCYNSVDHM